MDDIKERPSKIRKVEPTEESKETEEAISASPDVPKNSPSHPAKTQGERKEGNGESPAEDAPKLSKSQLKKLRKKKQWEAGREDRKARRREKHKEKQGRKAEVRAELAAKIAAGKAEPPPPPPKQLFRRPIPVPVTLILDCDFDDYMNEREIMSLGAQVTRCYSDNRTNPYRAHLAISSWGGKLKERFEGVLADSHLAWKGVRFIEKDFVGAAEELDSIMRGPSGGKLAGTLAEGIEVPAEKATGAEPNAMPEESAEDKVTEGPPDAKTDPSAKSAQVLPPPTDSNPQPQASKTTSLQQEEAPKADKGIPTPSIVYLSSESEHTLERLSPNTSYIIGGIVDKNRHKGLCYKRACELGIPTAKLPIGEYMTMQSRTVLAVNHVVEIMLKWLVKGDWGEAFLEVIPKRKEARLRDKNGQGKDNGVTEGDEESEDDSMDNEGNGDPNNHPEVNGAKAGGETEA
jgi:tRNA (guanine9-N1)-methyltransferase